MGFPFDNDHSYSYYSFDGNQNGEFAAENEVICSNTEDEIFNWSRNATLLLINEFAERKDTFRNPKIKKKCLWAEIVLVFLKQGYCNITIEILDRKWRNMKKTYKAIKDNKGRTGRGRITWEYYDKFEEIHSEDKTINIPQTVSSFSESEQRSECITNIPNMLDSIPGNCGIEQVETINTELNKKSVKNSKSRALYSFRKRQMEIEEQRIDEIKKLREAVVESNNIQTERNIILKLLLEKQNSITKKQNDD